MRARPCPDSTPRQPPPGLLQHGPNLFAADTGKPGADLLHRGTVPSADGWSLPRRKLYSDPYPPTPAPALPPGAAPARDPHSGQSRAWKKAKIMRDKPSRLLI
jgi:hypothetical protein